MCSFLFANWLLQNLTRVNVLLGPRGPDATTHTQVYGYDFVHNLLHMTGEFSPQPFHDEENDVVALFNGEIYNWDELRYDEFSKSDGDVIIGQYLRLGQTFPRVLDGEFALALLDFKRGVMVLATDVFGTKPLWLSYGEGESFAVSTYKSALASAFDDGGIVQTGGAKRVGPNEILVLEFRASTPIIADFLLQAPLVVSAATTYEFDLRQYKQHTLDWRAAFLRAVKKRSQTSLDVALALSDGYDSGAISLALAQLNISHSSYTVQAREKVETLMERANFLMKSNEATTLFFAKISIEDFDCERKFLFRCAERYQYRMREAYTNADDKAAVGSSWIFRQARQRGHRLFLSGSGADEILSDYGIYGRPIEFHSTLNGIFPDDLSRVFPWLNFFLGTMMDYLGKEETTAGAHGIESRYPFLDKELVQEYLWLAPVIKNSVYKAPIFEMFRDASFPFLRDEKKGFSADKNLVGATGKVSTDRFWVNIASRKDCVDSATTAVFLARQANTESLNGTKTACDAENQRSCVVQLTLAEAMGSFSKDDGWQGRLANLPTMMQAKEALIQDVLSPTLSLAVSAGYQPKHEVVFMTSCMGDEYFMTYCYPLISSFEEAYGNDDSPPALLIAYARVSRETVEKAAVLVRRTTILLKEEHSDYDLASGDAEENMVVRRIYYQKLKLKQYLTMWQEGILNDRLRHDYIVLMDSDMLIVKPFQHVFEYLSQRKVDVAFTYYDGNREVPWGTREELSRTKGGYVRLQGGMVIFSNSVAGQAWLSKWLQITGDIVEEIGQGFRPHLLEEFKGPSQAAFAHLLSNGDLSIMEDIQACCGSLRILTMSTTEADDTVNVRVLGVPTRFLNDAESSEDGRLPREAHVAHLKGHWWRVVLPEGNTEVEAPTRTYAWNKEVFELWRRHYYQVRP